MNQRKRFALKDTAALQKIITHADVGFDHISSHFSFANNEMEKWKFLPFCFLGPVELISNEGSSGFPISCCCSDDLQASDSYCESRLCLIFCFEEF